MSQPLGFGLGLRSDHYQDVLDQEPKVDWFEIISENFMVAGGKPRYYLDAVAERYPIVMHGVSLSIGSVEPLDWDYLHALKALADHVQPAWLSDHLCFTSVHGVNSHDLLPLPYTREAVHHVAGRVRQIQDFLGRRILLENVSSYLSYKDAEMSEWDFVNAVAAEADCLLLLDVNNIHVSAVNHGFDALEYLQAMDPGRVQQFHLAGHSNQGDHLIDTHDQPVPDPVWELYRHAMARFGPVSTLLERDEHIPPLAELVMELDKARQLAATVRGAA
ncbi:DUF692 domain-containing protein [Gallaecimonas sp. GXIMD4217]|uniref:MNIO family bufferin maturase n=1 Tax=Gallaecimonas sp. GXIMD4217 TaxID=3131927 RepID=UPI00311ABB4E